MCMLRHTPSIMVRCDFSCISALHIALKIRRVYLSANHVVDKTAIKEKESYEQLDLFTDYEAILKEREEEKQEYIKEEKMQKAVLTIKRRYGKNAILKGMNLVEGAMTRERNEQIGGHRA